jgi:integrase
VNDLSRYIFPRGKQGMLQLRVPVPRALHGRFLHPRTRKPCKELTKKLGTTDRTLAVKVGRPILVEWERLFRACAAGETSVPPTNFDPTVEELEQAAVTIGYDFELDEMDQGRRRLRHASPSFWQMNVGFYRQLLADRSRDVATGNTKAAEELADDALDILGWGFPKGSELYEQFCELVAQANLAALKVSDQRNSGNVDAEPDSKLVQRVKQREASAAPDGQTMMELFDRYAEWLRREDEGGIVSLDEKRRIVELFSEFVGGDRDIRSISPQDAVAFHDALAAAPSGYSKRSDFKGLSLKQAVEKGEQLGLQSRSKTTLNKEASYLSAFFAWVKKRRYIDAHPCPAADFRYRVSRETKEERKRPAFSANDLNIILKSPLFVGYSKDGKEHLVGDCRADDWRKWVPLICLFTGARIGEVSQLFTDDVHQVQGVWVIRFKRSNIRGTRVKTGTSNRIVPVHSKLVGMGFLEFVRCQATDAGSEPRPLFSGLAPDKRGEWGAKPSRFFRRHLERIGLKHGADGQGSHSFRHGMTDALRTAGFYDYEYGTSILGHANSTMTGRYGAIPQGTLEARRRMIEAVIFDGVDFDHLIPA